MTSMSIPLDNFEKIFGKTTELSSVALGGKVVSVSDEFFAAASQLLLVEPPPSLKGQFGPNGALYSGWESRRHNPEHDWCIVKLGTTGTIVGFDIDTTHFNGNEAPQASVEACLSDKDPTSDDPSWEHILSKVDLGPSSRHLFKIPSSPRFNYMKLNMYPDGGIARFRVFGFVAPVHPSDLQEPFDMAHVFAGGHVEFTSDQHFGVGSNLILPGRGKDMGDGWETKRSRQPGHKDRAIIRLGAEGFLEQIEIDTAHFKGNFPESCEVHAIHHPEPVDWAMDKGEQRDWTLILPRTKLGPHRRHFFPLQNATQARYTHVKVTMHPDGGIKRVRVIGRRELPHTTTRTPSGPPDAIARILPLLPLTVEAFKTFGQVIQAYDVDKNPADIKITPANNGTALKFHKLSLLASSYPAEANATAGLSVYRCQPTSAITPDGLLLVAQLERHPYTNQAFVPMGVQDQDSQGYFVVVAKSHTDGSPDLETLQAFKASPKQGIVYDTGIWHQPMTVFGKQMDLTCVETQIGDGSPLDCEVVDLATPVHLQVSGSLDVL